MYYYYFVFALIHIYLASADAEEFSYEIPCGIPNGVENFEEKIVNGEVAKPHEFPWMVSIQVQVDGEYIHNCGGVVIHSEFVLTAGHCTYVFDKSILRFAAGKMNIKNSEDTEQYRFAKKVIYSGYINENYKNDIALVQVDKPFELNQQSVAPICIPTGNEDYYNKCLTAGWGKTSEVENQSDILLKVMLSRIDYDKCRKLYSWSEIYLHDCQFCTLERGKDSCQGDSGGPIICGDKNDDKLYITGIISWGNGCARRNSPGVNTDVLCFKDWIKDTINNKNPKKN